MRLVSRRRGAAALLGLALCAGAIGPAPAGAQASAPRSAFSPKLDRTSVSAVADAVAAWQFANIGDLPYVTTFKYDSKLTRGWVQGTLYIGALRWAQTSGSEPLLGRVRAWAETNQYRLGDRLYHADDHTVARVYLEMHRAGLVDAQAITSTKAYFDAILAVPATLPLTWPTRSPPPLAPQDRWSWCDALFMAPPAWFALAAITGDGRYADFADREFWATTDYLFSKADGLYFRDSRFFDQRGPQGEKLFWGRGNGWVMGGLVAILETLPASDPRRARYETLFKAMAASLLRAQQRSGFWSSSLLATDGAPEASGTAFFVFGLQRGIDLGLLPARAYRPAVERGWAALVGAVGPDGRLGYVQQIGDAPELVKREDTQLYGSGALMLAASAIYAAAPR